MEAGKDYTGVGCGGVILNKNNEILLIKRSDNVRNKKGFWCIPGGKVRYNERVEDALKREVKEEIGSDIEVIKLLTHTNDILLDEGQHWVGTQHLCKIKSGTPKLNEPDNFTDIKWFPLNNVPEKITPPTRDGINSIIEDMKINKIIKKYRQSKNNIFRRLFL